MEEVPAEDVHARLQGQLDGNEKQQGDNSLLQVDQIAGQSGKDKIERAQAQDREDHRCVDQKRLLCHRDDGGNRIEREHDVGGLGGHQTQKGGRGEHCCLSGQPQGRVRPGEGLYTGRGDEEPLRVETGKDRYESLGEFHRPVFRIIRDLFGVIAGGKHLPPRPRHDGGKAEPHPRRQMEQPRTGGHEDGAEDQRADDTPIENPVLKRALDTEGREDGHENHQVVHRQ
ncbi:MAG: hypothetical protein FD153_1664 [Rhodospirillaceae bacterium]|nr:MAG: hypothetical protein FD153_1664 [Rhodospirillaceae bacterium]